MEKISKGSIQRKNPKTHVGDKWLPVIKGKGIITEPSAISHCEAVWDVRKMLCPYFAEIYGTGDLWCSFDRINIQPDARLVKDSQPGQWMHIDQSPLLNGMYCIQGFFDFYGTGPNEAGLVVAEKSHLDHHSLLFQEWGIEASDNWHLFTNEERAYIDKKYKVLKVQCPPRSIVLWDSRTFHCNTPPKNDGHGRTVVYVCCLPRSLALNAKDYEELCRKRQTAFMDKRSTSHWPVTLRIFPLKGRGSTPRVFDLSDDVIRQPDILKDKMVASLVGFSEGLKK